MRIQALEGTDAAATEAVLRRILRLITRAEKG